MANFDQNLKEKFDKDGFVVIEDFLSQNEVDQLRNEMGRIVEEMDASQHPKTIFTTHESDRQHFKDRYFLDSVDKISYFYEEDAFKDGKLVVDKHKALNKVGHALHWLNPTFKRVSFSDKVQRLMELLSFEEPIIPQSMYIFKQPGIGGEVRGHMDATFLLADPPTKLVGLWFALDDATEENGCLWFVPGSHRDTPVKRKLVRTRHNDSSELLKFIGADDVRQDAHFVPAPVRRGGCVLIHGLVWHKSEANLSTKPRHAYTFHIFDQGNGAVWNPDGWLQPTANYAFPRLFPTTDRNGK